MLPFFPSQTSRCLTLLSSRTTALDPTPAEARTAALEKRREGQLMAHGAFTER